MMPSIPWTAILAHAPAIVAAAERLFATARPNQFTEQTRGIEARLARLEKGSEESARLIQEIAQQLQALTLAEAAAVRQTRVAIIVAAVAVGLAVAAGVLAFVR
jgi:hypothetical protein